MLQHLIDKGFNNLSTKDVVDKTIGEWSSNNLEEKQTRISIL